MVLLQSSRASWRLNFFGGVAEGVAAQSSPHATQILHGQGTTSSQTIAQATLYEHSHASRDTTHNTFHNTNNLTQVGATPHMRALAGGAAVLAA